MKVPAMTLKTLIRVLAIAACVEVATVAPNAGAGQAPGAAQAVPAAPGTAAQAPGRGRGPQPVDPRVQIRMHHFAETNQDIPYSLFVSSKVKKNKKALATFEGFPYSHKKEYVEWVTEAKTDETRNRRLATTVEWLAEGKSRNWKYAGVRAMVSIAGSISKNVQSCSGVA